MSVKKTIKNRHQLPPGPGRPKGSKNKIPSTIKEDMLWVHWQLGGAQGMLAWVRENKRNLRDFYNWIASMIPKDQVVRLEEQIPKTIVIRQPAKPNNEQ